MIDGVIHNTLQIQPHLISFYGITSRIRLMFLLFREVSRNWRYESEPPLKPLPLTCGTNSIIVLMFVESQTVTYRAPLRYVTKTWSVVLLNKKKYIYSYLKCIVYDKLLKPRQSFSITLYFGTQINIINFLRLCIKMQPNTVLLQNSQKLSRYLVKFEIMISK